MANSERDGGSRGEHLMSDNCSGKMAIVAAQVRRHLRQDTKILAHAQIDAGPTVWVALRSGQRAWQTDLSLVWLDRMRFISFSTIPNSL